MKKRNVLALAGVLSVCAIGGTLAYFNQTMEVENNFNTGKYGSTIVEEFKPSDGEDWKPGVEVPKEVTITNTGDQDLVARVKFDETWSRDETAFVEIKATDKNLKNEDNKIMTNTQGDPADGIATAIVDDSVVEKTLGTDWADSWSYNAADGYYYYKTILTKAAPTTTALLEKVKLLTETDMGKFAKTLMYKTSEKGAAEEDWTAFPEGQTEKTINDYVKANFEGKEVTGIKSVIDYEAGLAGYSDADYVLKITAQTVQATDKAVKDAFSIEDAYITELGWNLKKEAITE